MCRTALLALLVLFLAAGCSGSGAQAPDPPGGDVSSISVSGAGAYPDGTPVTSSSVQFQLFVDGSNLFHPDSQGCTQTPAHVAGTVIQQGDMDSKGAYALTIPVQTLHAAVVKKCEIGALPAKQVSGIRIDASVLADASNCPIYCAAQTAAGDSCVSDCESGGRTLQASAVLDGSQLSALLAGSGGRIVWQAPLNFSSLGPTISSELGPDLVVNGPAAQASAHVTQELFSSDSCEVQDGCVRAAGMRTLLRFDGDIENLGSGDLELGDPNGNPAFVLDQCHHVPLLDNIMAYQLQDSNGQVVQTGDGAVIGRKAGFCMMDIAQVNSSAPEGVYDCSNQGISVGWEDIYDSSLDCQFLDVTGVPAGDYVLKLTVNPSGIFPESDYSNNSASVPVHIP
jgi:hypothetical protein